MGYREQDMGEQVNSRKAEMVKPASIFDCDVSDNLKPTLLLDLARKHRLVAVCCEPGYCSASTLRSVGIQAERAGLRFYMRDFASASPATAHESLLRTARDAYSKALDEYDVALVAINQLPPCDEAEVSRICKAVERLLKSNCLVILTVLPEARQLLDDLPSHLMLTSDDLCDVSAISRDGTGFVKRCDGLTRGIPVLVRALGSYRGEYDPDSLPLSYWDGLARLLESGLRDSLCEDELRLRLVIALLGHGSLNDLVALLGVAISELYYDLSLWAPFYGASADSGSFFCLTDRSHQWLNHELPTFSCLMSREQELLGKCLAILGERGEFSRMAALMRFASEETARAAVLEWAPELVDAGYLLLVAKVMEPRKGKCAKDDSRSVLIGHMVTALGSERPGTMFEGGPVERFFPAADEKASLCLALIGLRRRLRTLSSPSVLLSGDGSAIKIRLETHNEVMDALLSGRFGRALEALASVSLEGKVGSVTECLLRIDLAIAQIMACGVSWDDRASLEECGDFLSSKGYFGLLGYVWSLELVIEALCSTPAGTAALMRSKAARSGDAVVKSLAHVSEALGLLRKKPNAYIVAAVGAARNMCRELGWTYGVRVCGVLDQVGHYRLGESAGLYVLDAGDGVGVVSEVVGELTHDMRSVAVPLETRMRPVPIDELWLLVALCDGMGEFSGALEDQVPVEWRRALDVSRKNCLSSAKLARGPIGSDRELRGFGCGCHGVRITLFGEFELTVDGKKVSDLYLGVREAKPLIEFLALQPGHMASRERAALVLWPEVSDGKKARQKVYSATAAARKALLKHGYKGDLFSSNKAMKTVGLANDTVSCDVDEFIGHANAAIEGSGDARVCDSALKAESLYSGDLCILSDDQSGYLTARREQLKLLYAESMMAGGEAALRLDKKRLAARFANDVLYVDETREDAMALLIRALRRSGRSDEARRRFNKFARRLEMKTGRSPSIQLQSTLSEPLGVMVRVPRAAISDGGSQ